MTDLLKFSQDLNVQFGLKSEQFLENVLLRLENLWPECQKSEMT